MTSLIGKLIVAGATRDEALERLKGALDGLEIGPIKTTVPLHQALARDPDVKAGRVSTQWLEAWLATGPLQASAGARERAERAARRVRGPGGPGGAGGPRAGRYSLAAAQQPEPAHHLVKDRGTRADAVLQPLRRRVQQKVHQAEEGRLAIPEQAVFRADHQRDVRNLMRPVAVRVRDDNHEMPQLMRQLGDLPG